MMQKKQRNIPFQVTSWMERDVSIRKVTANARLINNETHQNIVLSRKFFSDLMNLSMERYRRINRFEHDQRHFLRSQYKKSETALPGLRPYIEYEMLGLESARSPDRLSSRLRTSELVSSSIQSGLAPLESKSDPSFDKQIRAQLYPKVPLLSRTRSDIISVNDPPMNGNSLTKQRVDRLAIPKGFRIKTRNAPHVRPYAMLAPHPDEFIREDTTISLTEPTSYSTPTPAHLLHAADDVRFRSLIGTFAEIHERQPSRFQNIQDIIQSNSSLIYCPEPTKASPYSGQKRKLPLRQQQRQAVAKKLHQSLDNQVIEASA